MGTASTSGISPGTYGLVPLSAAEARKGVRRSGSVCRRRSIKEKIGENVYNA